jgi:lysophospholipase L1-like esterase
MSRITWVFVCLVACLALSSVKADTTPGSLGPIDVYLIGGQSNATGQGYMSNLPKDFVINTDVLLFNSGPPHLDSGAAPLTWVPLRQASESPDRFGPELGFGNRIQELSPEKKIALIKHAHSGTSLYGDWNPGKNADDQSHWGGQFKTFVDTVQAGLQGLRDQGYQPILRGMIWQQGENDINEGHARAYGRNLAHFIGRVREQFNVPDLRFIYGYVYPPPNNQVGRDDVRLGEKKVDQNSGDPLAVKNAFAVETDDLSQRASDPNTPLPNDHVHFGTEGMLDLGKRMAEKMVDPTKTFFQMTWPTDADASTLGIDNILSSDDAIVGLKQTQKGGPNVLADSSDYGGDAETVANVIDDDPSTKYFNRAQDGANPPGINTGFVIKPKIGGTVVTQIQFATANDVPDRDPMTITLEGSNDANAMTAGAKNFTLIYVGTTGLDPDRFNFGQLITFPNTVAYQTYRVLVTKTRGDHPDSTQYSEVKLLGTHAKP